MSVLDECFVRAFRALLFDQPDDPQYVKGLGKRERPFSALERSHGRDADAGERSMLALRHSFSLPSTQGLFDKIIPVEGAYSRILWHAPLTISA